MPGWQAPHSRQAVLVLWTMLQQMQVLGLPVQVATELLVQVVVLRVWQAHIRLQPAQA